MSEIKKSFILYSDVIHTVRKMSKEKAGELFLTILEYVNGGNPQPDDLLIEIAFEPIKQQLDRDISKWEEIKQKRSRAGHASAESKKQMLTNSTHVNMCQQGETNSTDNVNESVNDIVNVTVNDNVNERGLNGGSSHSEKNDCFSVNEISEYFIRNGGSQKMAEKFFNKYSSTGWVERGTRIKDFRGLAKNFIFSWKENDQNRTRPFKNLDASAPGTIRTPL